MNRINKLINPEQSNNDLELQNLSEDLLYRLLYMMTLIRRTEEKIADEKKAGNIIGPVHLGVGQEAIAAGISKNLKKSDMIFGTHRSHAHLISVSDDLVKLFSEILGKSNGFSKGMGGSMHLTDKENGFIGSVPIVSGTVPLAVGAALASKIKNEDNISVAYFGDGAIEEGIVHESLNLAKIYNLPVLFVVENNLFASHMYIKERQFSEKTSRFAEANGIDNILVDGNNIIEIYQSSKKMINRMREGSGPGFLEAITYRWLGHVDWRDDIDVGVNRSLEDVKKWKDKDPIHRLFTSLKNHRKWDIKKLELINDEINKIIEESWEEAKYSKYPEVEAISKYVYKNV